MNSDPLESGILLALIKVLAVGRKGGRLFSSMKLETALTLKCPMMKVFLLGLNKLSRQATAKTGEKERLETTT